MQQLLELPSKRSGGNGGSPKRLRYILIAISFAVICYFAFMMGASQARTDVVYEVEVGSRDANMGSKKLRSNGKQTGVRVVEEDAQAESNAPAKKARKATPVSVSLLPPWGYNKDRNIPRAKAILGSIAADVEGGRFAVGKGFSVVDYGSDQGYFSISVAKNFPTATVMGLEMGGVGGEIWKKADSQDVLVIQEDKIREHGVESNMQICQAKMLPERFFALKEKQLVSDYQFVLSVFHWFELPTRKEFDETISALFMNARTTFIELPIIGDNSPLIRKQVGWRNFVKWYDGRTDMTQIIVEAAESQGLSVKVTLVAAVPWVKWQRETYRVDVQSIKAGDDAPAVNFGCSERRDIYQCAKRELFSACH